MRHVETHHRVVGGSALGQQALGLHDRAVGIGGSVDALRRFPEGLAEFRHGLCAVGGVEHVALQGDDRQRRIQLAVVQDGARSFCLHKGHQRLGEQGGFDLPAQEHLEAYRDLADILPVQEIGSGPFLLEELREQKINDGGAGNRNVLPFEVGQRLRFGLGGDDESETAVVRGGVRSRRHNSLRRAAFILHEDVDDIPEMPAQRPRPHGGTELQRALEGDKLHFQPLFGEQAFVRRDVQDDGVGGGEDAKLERGAVRGLDGGKDEQGKED